MARALVGAVALVAVALLYPVTSRAATQRTVRLEAISLDPDQVPSTSVPVPDGTPTICCASITDCQAVPIDPVEGLHNPAIVFTMLAADTVHVEAGIWSPELNCPGDPPNIASGDLDRPAGLTRIRIVFTPPLDDGTPLSLKWSLTASCGAQCPVTACANYPSLGTPPPDLCPI